MAVRYDAEGADELVFLDITASSDRRDTTIDMVRRVAEEVFIPFTVGGGIRTVDDARRMLRAGADKVAANTAAVERPAAAREIADEFGAQCAVCAIDAKRREPSDRRGGWTVYLHGGRTPTGIDAVAWAAQAADLGAGEILLTSMDRDGTGDGFDLELTRAVVDAVGVPVIASGGVGTLEHLADGIVEGGADAVLAASIFHYDRHTIAEAKACSPLVASSCVPSLQLDRTTVTDTDEHGVQAARAHRHQGVGVVVRVVGDVRHPGRRRRRRRVHAGRPRRRLQLLRQRRGLRRWPQRGDHGRGAAPARSGRGGRTSSRRSCSGASTTTSTCSNTLNRKYLMQAIDGSLERFGLDFVDVVYCHRADPETPIEETVWAMSDIVSSGKALYWGTSEWPADGDPRGDRGRRAPPPPQARSPSSPSTTCCSASASSRSTPSCSSELGYGTTIWSPLASGLLTGKYRDGIPADSRGALAGYDWLAKQITDPAAVAKVEKLRPIADELGCTLAQLALAWCTKNPNVSTVITGASRASQVVENFAALDVIPALTPEVLERIERGRSQLEPARLDSLQSCATSDDKLPIQMLNDRLLVRIPDGDGERRSQGGILIPATAQMAKRLVWAEVVAHGQHVRSAEVGDLVLFSPEDRYEVEVQGCDYIMLRERDIHAVAAQRIEASTGLYL